MAKKIKTPDDLSTEDKIKEAARTIFMQKGYSATRTRDIAEAADINLALLNYYFRSKEKLFDIIMLEIMQQFVAGLKESFQDEKTSLLEKVQTVAEKYTTLFMKIPDLPLFVLGEIQARPEEMAQKMNLKEVVLNTSFFRQIQEATPEGIHPINCLLNLLSLIVFPFAASPLIKIAGQIPPEAFQILMQQRLQMIPLWFDAMINTKVPGHESNHQNKR
ncbi:MAG: TetR/AcrR family transcriptional regulator [Saprospiraceae bacterium]